MSKPSRPSRRRQLTDLYDEVSTDAPRRRTRGPQNKDEVSVQPRTTGQVWLRRAPWIAALVVVPLFLQAGGAAAQTEDETRVQTMTVSILPEYDDPSVLVMAQGEFSETFSPQEVEFALPPGAEVTQACALTKPDYEHLCQPYVLSEGDNSLMLRYTLPLPTFFFEYYYNPVADPAAPRNVEYRLQPTYPVDSLVLEVQEPLRSSDFSLQPPSDEVFSDNQGFRYYYYDYEALTPDEPVSLNITYLKSDGQPSVQPRAQAGASGVATEDDGGLNRVFLVVVSLGIVGLLAFLAFGRRAGLRTAAAGLVPSSSSSPRATRTPANPDGAPPGRSFCAGCGQPLQKSFRFCPSCGRAARRPTGRR